MQEDFKSQSQTYGQWLPLFLVALAFGAGVLLVSQAVLVAPLRQALYQAVIGAGAIVFSAVYASIYAIKSLSTNTSTTRQKATLDLLVQLELDEEYVRSKSTWVRYRSNGEFAALFSFSELRDQSADQPDSAHPSETKGALEDYDDVADLRAFFNMLELIALGIKQGILDKKFLAMWFETAYYQTWQDSVEAIGAIRTLKNNHSAYEHFEELAESWQTKRDPFKNAIPFTLADLKELGEARSRAHVERAAQENNKKPTRPPRGRKKKKSTSG